MSLLYGSHTFAINSDFVALTAYNLGCDWVTEALIKFCDIFLSFYTYGI